MTCVSSGNIGAGTATDRPMSSDRCTSRERRRRRLSLPALATLIALLIPLASAYAHDLPQERALMVQLSEDRVELMLVYLEPPGRRLDLFMTRYDWNADGELTGPEVALAGPEWAQPMLHGLQFEVAGERPKAQPPEVKFRREQKGALSAALYARYDLPELDAGESRTFHVRMLRREQNVPTAVTFRTSEGVEISGLDLPERLSGPTKPVLRPGEQATVKVVVGQGDEN